MFRTLQVPFLRRSSGPKLTRGLVDLVTTGPIAARVLGPVMKPALSKAKDATTRVSHWVRFLRCFFLLFLLPCIEICPILSLTLCILPSCS